MLRSLTVSRVGKYQSPRKITFNLDYKWRVWERAITFSPVLIFKASIGGWTEPDRLLCVLAAETRWFESDLWPARRPPLLLSRPVSSLRCSINPWNIEKNNWNRKTENNFTFKTFICCSAVFNSLRKQANQLK